MPANEFAGIGECVPVAAFLPADSFELGNERTASIGGHGIFLREYENSAQATVVLNDVRS